MHCWGKLIIPHLLSVIITKLMVVMQDQNLWGVILELAFLPFTVNHLQKAISFSNSVVWFFFKWGWQHWCFWNLLESVNYLKIIWRWKVVNVLLQVIAYVLNIPVSPNSVWRFSWPALPGHCTWPSRLVLCPASQLPCSQSRLKVQFLIFHYYPNAVTAGNFHYIVQPIELVHQADSSYLFTYMRQHFK